MAGNNTININSSMNSNFNSNINRAAATFRTRHGKKRARKGLVQTVALMLLSLAHSRVRNTRFFVQSPSVWMLKNVIFVVARGRINIPPALSPQGCHFTRLLQHPTHNLRRDPRSWIVLCTGRKKKCFSSEPPTASAHEQPPDVHCVDPP